MKKLLIIEDDLELTFILTKLFDRHGYYTMAGNGGHEGLRLANLWQPDLIVLDIMMPDLDGFQVARELQKNEITARIPILMLTAKLTMDDKLHGLEIGAVDYITKPFSNQELLARVKSHLNLLQRYAESSGYQPGTIVGLPLLRNPHRSGLFRKGYRVSKRVFDFVTALLLMPIALPLMLVIALIIRLDSPGNAIFAQPRTGSSGKSFKMLKFRTMLENAEELKEKYRHLNELQWPDFKITNDPRITRVGRFLRKSSLDELPQLINILKGDMSFVGPRPTSFEASTYKLWQTERLEVRPGLTGLWQVVGRANIDFNERVELDIEYIERQGWLLDIQILFRTVGAVLTSRGAH